jgi:hypothetical protein
MTEDDMAEGSPDRLGSTLDMTSPDVTGAEMTNAEMTNAEMTNPNLTGSGAGDSVPLDRNRKPTPSTPSSLELARVVPAAIRTREAAVPPAPLRSPEPAPGIHRPESGTVVIDVEQGGILVPSFLGKHLRAAVELAEQNNLELEAVGSGVARAQSPPAGAHVAAGAKITVRFER